MLKEKVSKIRRKQAIDSIQNSSGKPNHQATDNWEIKLPDKGNWSIDSSAVVSGNCLSKSKWG